MTWLALIAAVCSLVLTAVAILLCAASGEGNRTPQGFAGSGAFHSCTAPPAARRQVTTTSLCGLAIDGATRNDSDDPGPIWSWFKTPRTVELGGGAISTSTTGSSPSLVRAYVSPFTWLRTHGAR